MAVLPSLCLSFSFWDVAPFFIRYFQDLAMLSEVVVLDDVFDSLADL